MRVGRIAPRCRVDAIYKLPRQQGAGFLIMRQPERKPGVLPLAAHE